MDNPLPEMAEDKPGLLDNLLFLNHSFAPLLIVALYWIVTVILIVASLFGVIGGFVSIFTAGFTVGLFMILVSLVALIVFLILVRLGAEFVFMVYQCLNKARHSS